MLWRNDSAYKKTPRFYSERFLQPLTYISGKNRISNPVCLLSGGIHLKHLHADVVQYYQLREVGVDIAVLHILNGLLFHCEVFVFKLVHCIRFYM